MIAYSGFHFQKPVNDWPRAAAVLPAGAWIKAIDSVQLLDEAKRINPGIKTVLRHFDGGWQRFDFASHEERRVHARSFLLSFVDGTFLQYAHNVDAIEELNEYNATSHSAADVQKRVEWVRAVSQEWAAIKASDSRLSHIRLVVGNVAIGNDLPLEAARLVQQYGNIAGYHPYVPTKNGVIRAGEWPHYSGRWTEMDRRFRAAGITVDWLFTEAGPIGYTGDHLWAEDGWRHPEVCGGNVDELLAICRYWMNETAEWNYAHGGRALGQVLYNSGGADNEWRLFEIAQPEMDRIAAFNRDYQPPTPPPPPPPPEPEPEPRRYAKEAHLIRQGLPRRQRIAVMDAAAEQMQSVFWSADDWALTLQSSLATVTARRLHAWNIDEILGLPEPEARRAIEDWVGLYYPDPPPEFIYHRIRSLFTAHTWRSPVGTAAERQSGQIWPGGWVDATGYLTRYRLGSGWAIHSGADLNLNAPVFDMDRNKPVYAAASGKVTYAGVPSHGWQGVVVIRHQDAAGAAIAYTRYAHLQPDEITVRAEDWVKVGEVVGLTGRNMTGDTPGPFHLHFDVSTTGVLLNDPGHWPGDNLPAVRAHYVDPEIWLQSRR